MSFTDFPNGAIATLITLTLSIVIIYVIKHYSAGNNFLTNVFLVALLARISFGLVIQIFDLQIFFGGDAVTYDTVGQRLVEIWQGLPVPNDDLTSRATIDTTIPGWGMYYFVGFIYFICGQSILVAQSVCAVVGAATAPVVYFCAEKVLHNQRVATTSALFIALFPSFIIWSSQLLKDGLIIFLLVFTMTMVLQLQKKFSYLALAGLIFALFGIISLRFYIFYMLAIAVAGSFIVGLGSSVKSLARNIVAIVLVGLALTYLGVLRNAGDTFEKFGSLERVQISRQYSATADSGFGEDADVSTTEGAITAIPIGFVYLMFAPFPWQIKNLRQAITLPEIFLWWALIPLLISGLWYTIKHRLKEAVPILLFSLMLTLAYSIFQGNIGTAYRQRAQIQVFLFIFIAVGWSVWQERRENQNLIKQTRRKNFRQKLQKVN